MHGGIYEFSTEYTLLGEIEFSLYWKREAESQKLELHGDLPLALKGN